MPRGKRHWSHHIFRAWMAGTVGCVAGLMVLMFSAFVFAIFESLVEGLLAPYIGVGAARGVSCIAVVAVLFISAWLLYDTTAYRWRKRREIARIRAGLCRKCGYDVRENEDRCPECGAIILRNIPADLAPWDRN